MSPTRLTSYARYVGRRNKSSPHLSYCILKLEGSFESIRAGRLISGPYLLDLLNKMELKTSCETSLGGLLAMRASSFLMAAYVCANRSRHKKVCDTPSASPHLKRSYSQKLSAPRKSHERY